MSLDVVDLRAFYASPLGHVTRRFIGQTVDRLLGSTKGLRVMGLGYAVPYMTSIRPEAERALVLMPQTQGVVNWPSFGLSSSCLADMMMMPLPDASIDRVMVVHALELVENPQEFLSEIWRILTPGGRIIVVTPNRQGLWARMDITPFGHGQPFSRSQLRNLMRKTLFTPDVWAEALYVPPLRSRILLRTAPALERIGMGLSLPFAGVHIVEATKQLYRPIEARQTRKALRLAPVFVPTPSGASVTLNTL
jgi:SAM-dependent methyltransferase